jgi:hypothetical protein
LGETAVKPTSAPRFLLVLTTLTIVGLVGALLVNAFVDPYGIWQWVELPGFPNRPMQRGHDRMYQAALIARTNPDGIVLGTSRAQVMVNPSSPALSKAALRVVNAALDGSVPYEARRLMEHAFARASMSQSRLRLVVFGLDLYAFDKSRKPDETHSEARLLISDAGRQQPFARYADVLPSLLSIDALLASGATLLRKDWPSYNLVQGQRDPRFQERGLQQVGGQRALFQASERDYAQNYGCFAEAESDAAPYADLRRLIREAASRAAKVRLYISPVHARHAVLVRSAGLSRAENRWKAQLVGAVEAAKAGGADVELWDFTQAAFDEPVPAASDGVSRMQWWWESSHATSALGERLLPRLLDLPGAEPIGQRLTSANLAAWSEELEARQAQWEALHASEVAEVEHQASSELIATRRSQCPQWFHTARLRSSQLTAAD